MLTESRFGHFLIAVVISVFLCSAFALAQTCLSGCRPWSSNDRACKHDSLMQLIFSLDVAPEHAYGPSKVFTNATYAFCPKVDQLQNFKLELAPYYATAYNTTLTNSSIITYSFSANLQPKYLSVYGFGNTADRIVPMRDISNGAVVIATNGNKVCGVANSVVVATTLVLNIGLHNGLFNYIADSPTGNFTIPSSAAALSKLRAANMTFAGVLEERQVQSVNVFVPSNTKQPAMTGFVPTCNSNNVCLFDSSMKCVGHESGRQNCAQCFTNPSDISNAAINVWVSYYGTDSSHETLLSGSSNPLNYLSFAARDTLQRFVSMLTSLF